MKRINISLITILLLMVAGLQTAWAQKVTLYKTSGQTIECNISELDSIVFSEAEPVLVTSIELSETSITLQPDESKTLTWTVLPEDADNPAVTWASSDEAVAIVAEGLVVAVAEGTCTITCSATDGSGVYAECQVTVVTDLTHGTTDGHEWVDLGLPSGTLWATCNVGANSPEEYGDYFAWGETEPKDEYDWSTYKYCNGSVLTLTKYCNDSSTGYNGFTDSLTELLPEDDAATANWGSGWQMPSSEQIDELLNNTTTIWTTQNGINGRLCIASNGNSIFLPAAGCRRGTSLDNAGSYGYYWSRSLHTIYVDDAYSPYFYSDRIGWNNLNRRYGQSVRPVRVQNATPSVLVTSITVNGVTFKMVSVEGGTFQMGSTDGEDDEQPVHQVTLSSFAIGETEVTQELWEAVMGSNPSSFSGSKLPVECVSKNDCQRFITKLNELTGKTFRLPTEAEWEFAARGGNLSNGYTYSGSNTLGDVAWHRDNSDETTHEVATKAPNELGIYDMSGNVWEWCQDLYGYYSSDSQTNPTGPASGSRFVIRGGSWYSNAPNCRVANRDNDYPSEAYYGYGFRLAQ